MKKTSLVLTLIVGVLLSSTSAWAQAPLPKVRLEGLPMLSLAAANLPAQTGARDDLPALGGVQRGRRWVATGAGFLAASAFTFAMFGRKDFCHPYDSSPKFLASPFIIGSALAAAGLSFTIAGAHRIHDSAKGGSAWKRWRAPLLLGAGVSAVTAGAAAVGPFMEGFGSAGCFNS